MRVRQEVQEVLRSQLSRPPTPDTYPRGLRRMDPIQLLEPDFLDDSRLGVLPNGNKVVQGVEFDPIGQRAAYWLFPEHPGNNFAIAAMGLVSKPVPASEIAHLYEHQRTQARGVPWAA